MQPPHTVSKRKFDVIIVGAGIVGLSCAYHILSEEPSTNVLLIEKAPSAGQGDTAKSGAAIRNMFTSEVNRLLAETSIDFYSHIQDGLGFPLRLEFVGYLWLLTSGMVEHFYPIIERMRRTGIALKVWDSQELSEMLPESKLHVNHDDKEAQIMRLSSIVKGVQGLRCGTIGPEKLVEFYEAETRKMGATIHYSEPVRSLTIGPKLDLPREPLVWQRTNVTGVETFKGNYEAECTILATGAWTPSLLDPLGIDSHIRTKKRQVFSLKGPGVRSLLYAKGFNEQGVLPLTIVPPCSAYIKPNRVDASVWVGVSDYVGRSFAFEEEPIAEQEFYEYNIYPVISHYFPHFLNVRPFNKWAGHYDMNTVDANPYIFEFPGLIVAVGTSGSGIIKADAIGRIVAAAHMKKEIATLYGGKHFKVSRLGIETRDVEPEGFVI
jgi:glycine/D-amino acid oxidase-like deaminating enzyme